MLLDRPAPTIAALLLTLAGCSSSSHAPAIDTLAAGGSATSGTGGSAASSTGGSGGAGAGGAAGGAAGVAGGGGTAGNAGGSATYVPMPNGVPLSEAAACTALRDAYNTAVSKNACIATVQACPQFLQTGTKPGTACSEWDEGVVKQCLAYYAGLTTCELLLHAPCNLVMVPGSAGKGC